MQSYMNYHLYYGLFRSYSQASHIILQHQQFRKPEALNPTNRSQRSGRHPSTQDRLSVNLNLQICISYAPARTQQSYHQKFRRRHYGFTVVVAAAGASDGGGYIGNGSVKDKPMCSRFYLREHATLSLGSCDNPVLSFHAISEADSRTLAPGMEVHCRPGEIQKDEGRFRLGKLGIVQMHAIPNMN